MDKRDLMLHLKSLIWCLSKNQERYNLRLVLDSLRARHVPESIQGAPLGKNLAYLIHELSSCEGLQSLSNALKMIPKSEIRIKFSGTEIELGQYLKTQVAVGRVPPGSYGVTSFLGDALRGLFYVEGAGIVEQAIAFNQVETHKGIMI